jgi:hypothetical protein
LSMGDLNIYNKKSKKEIVYSFHIFTLFIKA